MKKSRPFLLLEILIGAALAALILGAAFQLLVFYGKEEARLEKTKTALMNKEFVYLKLASILDTNAPVKEKSSSTRLELASQNPELAVVFEKGELLLHSKKGALVTVDPIMGGLHDVKITVTSPSIVTLDLTHASSAPYSLTFFTPRAPTAALIKLQKGGK